MGTPEDVAAEKYFTPPDEEIDLSPRTYDRLVLLKESLGLETFDSTVVYLLDWLEKEETEREN